MITKNWILTLLLSTHVIANIGANEERGRNIRGFDGEDTNYYNAHESTQKHFKDKKQRNEEEDVFYFFSLHDYNKDHHLDGHELALAFQGYEFYNGTEIENPIPRSDLEFMIDNALLEDDLNNDGKISWEEYLASQQYHHKLDTANQ